MIHCAFLCAAGPLEGREAAGEEAQEEDNVEKRPMMTEAEKLNYRHAHTAIHHSAV